MVKGYGDLLSPSWDESAAVSNESIKPSHLHTVRLVRPSMDSKLARE